MNNNFVIQGLWYSSKVRNEREKLQVRLGRGRKRGSATRADDFRLGALGSLVLAHVPHPLLRKCNCKLLCFECVASVPLNNQQSSNVLLKMSISILSASPKLQVTFDIHIFEFYIFTNIDIVSKYRCLTCLGVR